MDEDKIIELEAKIGTLSEDKEKVDSLLELCELVKENSSIKLNELSKQALDISERINYKLGVARSHKLLGQSYSHRSDFTNAIHHLEKALLLSRSLGEKKLEGNILIHLGIVHKNSDPAKAIELYYESLEIHKILNDRLSEAHLLNNIGVVFKMLGNYSAALEYYLQSLNIKEEMGVEKTIHNTLSNIGNIYVIMNEYDKALDYAMRSLKLLKKHNTRINEPVVLGNVALCNKMLGHNEKAIEFYREAIEVAMETGNRQSEADNYDGIGELYLISGDMDSALSSFTKGLEIAEDINDRSLVASIHLNLGKGYLQSGDYEKSLDELLKGLDHIKETDDKKMMGDYYQTISSYYESTGDYVKAMEYLKLHNDSNKELIMKQSEMVTKSLMIQHEAERHQKEAELNRVRNEELTRIVKRLDEINEDKNNFIGIVSHDLRDPVSSVYSIAELILGDYDNFTEDEKKDFINDIKTSADRVIKLLQTLLDINAIETGQFKTEFESNDLTEITKEVISYYKDRATAKNLDIRFTEEKHSLFYGDKRSVEQIISNLLSNAIKYSPPGKNIYIKTSEVDNAVRFEIDDEGPGLTEEDQKKLFGKFMRLSARPTAGEESFGLGLSIVKKLVNMNKGKVWCESEQGKGAKFFVELPKPQI